MRDASVHRHFVRTAAAFLTLFFASFHANALDVYGPAPGELTIPSLGIGFASYSNVTLTFGSILSGPVGNTPNGSADTYSPANNQLAVPAVRAGNGIYYNALVDVANLVSIGGVSGADTFDGTHLNIPYVQVGPVIYTNVVVAVSVRNVVNVAGGMPAVELDQYDATNGLLTTPAVKVGASVYTNVTVSVTSADVVAVGGRSGVQAPSGLSYASPVVLTLGSQAPTLSPTVSGRVSMYSVVPALPPGLSLNAFTGAITGTPVAEVAGSPYVITAMGPAGSTTFTLSLAVLVPAPSHLSYPSPDTFLVGTDIGALSPTVNGLVTRYGVSPALPPGLSLDTVTGQITGTPTTATAAASYLVSASNGSGTTYFSIQLSVLIPPPSGLIYPNPQVWVAGTPITPISPSVSGTVTQYSVAPALPQGITLNPVSGQISGTPSVVSAQSAYVVTASNSTGLTSYSLWITVLVAAPSALSYPSPQTFTAGTAITALNPTVTGTVTNYSAQPALPAGLLLNASTGQITGTPSSAMPMANYVITAANGTGSTNFTLTITVRIAAPSALSYFSPQTYHAGTPITPLRPTVTGVVSSYRVSPALPAGLALNTTTGVISGTPSQATASAGYTITASNSTGSTNFVLSISVVLLAPQSLSYPNPLVLAVGLPITALSPSVLGIVTSYTVTPALPSGLSLDAVTGQITGTPTVLSTAASYTIKATNSVGSTTFALSIAVAGAGVAPSQISRLVAVGTPVVVQLALQSQSLTGSLYVKASDPYNLFKPAVAVANAANGYALSLSVSTAIAAGSYSDTVLLTLCQDAACTQPQVPGSISVPFNVKVLSASGGWPGNNVTALSAWSGAPDWTMFQGNAAHTGYVPVTVDPNNMTTRWQGGVALANSAGYSAFAYTLTTDANQLYVATGNTLYAFRELDGSQVWSYSVAALQFPSVNPPSEANGTVYMAAGQQSSTYLYAFNEIDGSIVFKSQMSSQWEHYFAPTIGASGVYTNAGSYGGLYGFDFSGNQLFFDSLAQQSQWTPAVDDSHVYSYVGSLTVADPVTGAVQATITDPTFQNYTYAINGAAVLGAPGSVFAAAYENAYLNGGGLGNNLIDFNVDAQGIAWKVAGDYAFTPSYSAGIVYAANNNPLRLEARRESDGALLGSWTPPQAGENTFSSEVLLTNSMSFVSTNLATYGIDLQTGQIVFSYPFPGRLALSRNGVLYIQGTGLIVAINLK